MTKKTARGMVTTRMVMIDAIRFIKGNQAVSKSLRDPNRIMPATTVRSISRPMQIKSKNPTTRMDWPGERKGNALCHLFWLFGFENRLF